MYGNANPNLNLIDRFEDWWRRDNKGLPLMRVIAQRDDVNIPMPTPKSYEARYIDPEYLLAKHEASIQNNVYLADSYAELAGNIGPGCLAVYLGSEPQFAFNTVWYTPCIDDLETRAPLAFDPENKWWRRHFELLKTLKEYAGDEYPVNIPDLVENIDILSAMRGPQELMFDMMDAPEKVEQAVAEIDEAYFKYYDTIYDLVKLPEGISSYYCFQILGRGRVAKVQCDASALISPEQFRRFALPSLRKQVRRLDHSIYHLDGPDAIRHVPALMELEELDALQWTCGAGQPDGACPKWYGIYDQVAAAKKSLWVQIGDGGIDDWIRGADSLIDRYDKKMFYFLFPTMSLKDADKLLNFAHTHWE